MRDIWSTEELIRQIDKPIFFKTICAKCQHYSPAIYICRGPTFPAYCWANPSQEVTIDCVTGKQAYVAPVECYDKNHGQCPDYAFKPPEPLFTIDEPRKHWWQK